MLDSPWQISQPVAWSDVKQVRRFLWWRFGLSSHPQKQRSLSTVSGYFEAAAYAGRASSKASSRSEGASTGFVSLQAAQAFPFAGSGFFAPIETAEMAPAIRMIPIFFMQHPSNRS